MTYIACKFNRFSGKLVKIVFIYFKNIEKFIFLDLKL